MDRTKIETDGQKAAMIKKTPEQILSMTALELGAAIKAGKLTAVEAVKAVMEQADKTGGGADRHQRQYLHEGCKNLLRVKNTGRFQAVL